MCASLGTKVVLVHVETKIVQELHLGKRSYGVIQNQIVNKISCKSHSPEIFSFCYSFDLSLNIFLCVCASLSLSPPPLHIVGELYEEELSSKPNRQRILVSHVSHESIKATVCLFALRLAFVSNEISW